MQIPEKIARRQKRNAFNVTVVQSIKEDPLQKEVDLTFI